VSSIQFCVLHRVSVMSASRVSGLYTDSSGLRVKNASQPNITRHTLLR
jgi:hypothetical protein